MNYTPTLITILSLFLWGCGKDPITVQKNVPKDYEGQHLRWTLPDGWENIEVDNNMQMAAFSINNGDQNYKFTISTFSGGGGTDLDNLNRWFGQLGKPPANTTVLANYRKNLFFGTHTFQLFDLTDAESPENKQFFTAILRENNRSWFFKLEGAGVGFKKQKTAFQGFLATVRLQGEPDELAEPSVPRAVTAAGGVKIARKTDAPSGAPPPPSGPPPLPPGGLPLPPPIPPEVLEKMRNTPPPSIPSQIQKQLGSVKTPAWEVPEGWKVLPSTPMRRGNFSIQGEGGGSAEVSVIRLPANAGDLQSNITRWGRQVGISQENLSKDQPPVQQLEVGGSKATYVVLRGPERSTCVAIVRQGEGTWFFKLSGKNSLVEANRTAFEGFLQTVKF